MDEPERADCEGGTDGAQKGDSSEEGKGRSRKEGTESTQKRDVEDVE